jgi:hypothetical protein
MNTDTALVDTPSDGDEITEIERMVAKELHAVGSPASGIPFLLMKASAELPAAEALAIIRERRQAGDTGPISLNVRSDEVSALAKAVKVDAEGEGQSRHPETGQFISDEQLEELESEAEKATGAERDQINGVIAHARLRKMFETGDTTVMMKSSTPAVTSADLPELIQRLEKAIADPDLDPAVREEAGMVITRYRLAQHFEGRAAKGAIQDALGGTNMPELGGSFGTGISGVAGPVVTGAGPTRDNPALTLGGESTAQIPVEAKVTDNPPAPVTTDAAGIVPAAATGSGLDALARQRSGEDVTKERLAYLYALKGAAQIGGNRGDVTPTVTARADANDVNAVPDGGLISDKYLAKAERDFETTTDPAEKMALGVTVTRGRLQRRYSRAA